MEFKKIYASEFSRVQPLLSYTKMIFPFYDNHIIAKKYMVKAIYKQFGWFVKIQSQTVFFSAKLINRQMNITNILCSDLKQFSWHTALQIVETFARSRFAQVITFSFFAEGTLLEWLKTQGYQQGKNGLTKKLQYHTALVLSGGGARGAYQIGAWRALRELGISFTMITSTSVGALNAPLVMMNDVTKAQQLWHKISTEKILVFPQAAINSRSFRQLTQQLRSLGLSAVRDKGVSTVPLQKLLLQTLDEAKLASSSIKLYICTTRLRGLKEKVVAIEPSKQSWKWLAASAAFFPAMQPIRIKNEDYIDGGYRNDFPLDVALFHGAKECICVDAKGPGVRKKNVVPDNVVNITLRSPWPLGSFLIFDSKRSKINEQLGYLETLKYFQRYSGFWYTFTTETNWQNEWQAFVSKLSPKELSLLQEKEFWQTFYKLYGKKVPVENTGEAFVELIGRFLALLPDKIYTKDQFLFTLIVAKEKINPSLDITLSFTEWIELYHKKYSLLSKRNQFLFLSELLEKGTKMPKRFIEKSTVLFVTAKFFSFLKKTVTKNA